MSPSEGPVYHRLRFAHDGVEVSLVLEALRVDLVDVLRAGRPRREPAAPGDDLQPADRLAVARGAGQLGPDRFAGQLRLHDGLEGEVRQPRLLLGRRRRIDACVVRRAELLGQRPIVLARVVSGARGDLGRQEGHDRAVLVGGPCGADKDGPIMALLAAEITARTGNDPGEHYRALTKEFGTPYYTRIDAPATPEQKARLEKLSPEAVLESQLAGESVTATLTRAPGNNAPIGGLKVIARGGWFAARPSGTENIYKIYAESFKDQAHLDAVVRDAQAIVNRALRR